METIKPVDWQLRDGKLMEIAKNYPFSFEDIRIVFDTLKSFDATIKACEAACEMGMSSPVYITDVARLKPADAGEVER